MHQTVFIIAIVVVTMVCVACHSHCHHFHHHNLHPCGSGLRANVIIAIIVIVPYRHPFFRLLLSRASSVSSSSLLLSRPSLFYSFICILLSSFVPRDPLIVSAIIATLIFIIAIIVIIVIYV